MEKEKDFEKQDPKGLADKIVSKVVSRKLLVWVTATTALYMGILNSEEWTQICLLYIGSQAGVDLITSYIRAKQGTE